MSSLSRHVVSSQSASSIELIICGAILIHLEEAGEFGAKRINPFGGQRSRACIDPASARQREQSTQNLVESALPGSASSTYERGRNIPQASRDVGESPALGPEGDVEPVKRKCFERPAPKFAFESFMI
jgi:hypothetical protein